MATPKRGAGGRFVKGGGKKASASKPKARTSTKGQPERAKVKRTASGSLAASARKKSATIVQGGKARFPMPDKEHARLALADVKKAKRLSPGQKAEIRARAHGILGEK